MRLLRARGLAGARRGLRSGCPARGLRGRAFSLWGLRLRRNVGARHDPRRHPSGFLRARASSALLYLGLLAIPTRRLFLGDLWSDHAARGGLAAQAVAFLQQGGYVEILTSTVWDTSWLLPEDSLAGRLLHTLIGYTDRPSAAQLVVYLFTVALILTLMYSQRRSRAATPRPAVAEITSRS